MKTWPCNGGEKDRKLVEQVFEEYGLNEDTLKTFKGNPIDNLPEFFSLNIPLLIVAGGADEIVPFEGNSKILIDYCGQHDIQITSIVKPDCKHHPHSLEDVGPILDFVKR